jgi:energy-coupling factor transporter ATP-binding protein EcfA2
VEHLARVTLVVPLRRLFEPLFNVFFDLCEAAKTSLKRSEPSVDAPVDRKVPLPSAEEYLIYCRTGDVIFVHQLIDFDVLPMVLRKDLFPLERRQSGSLVNSHDIYASGLLLKDTPGSVNNATISYTLCEKTYWGGLMNMKRKLFLPKLNDKNVEIETTQSFILIGANGSGKTRLGAWIEISSPQKELVHRIPAQRELSMPDSTKPESIDIAEKDLLFGNRDWSYQHKHLKWHKKPATQMLSDYDKLLVFLFSNEIEENAKYKNLCRNSAIKIDPPLTKFDNIKEIWEKILPHRELVIGGLRIQTRIRGYESEIYNSSEMSDGERDIFYLIGQCLAAPKDGIIVVDEPELHLHKSVQIELWSEIERLRSDCLFVYITHDIEFAAAYKSATKIWLKSFDGVSWDWEQIASSEDLPDELLLEILGNRRSVLFVEGVRGSFDSSLYTAIFPNFLVLPIGSCAQVIQSVKSFKVNQQIHHLNVFGIIDRDRRTSEEISILEKDSIFVLNVAEVENLFCTKEVLEIVSNALDRDPVADFNAVSKSVFEKLQNELDTQVSLMVSSEIKYLLSKFEENGKSKSDVNQKLQDIVNKIEVSEIYNKINQIFIDILKNKDYNSLLSIYNRKSLSAQVSREIGLANNSLPETVMRLARGKCKSQIRDALKPYFGNFQQYMT